MISQKSESGRRPLRIGDHVSFIYGLKRLTGDIIEDRGKVGVGGRQLFLVEIPLEYGDPMRLELPEDELQREPNKTR